MTRCCASEPAEPTLQAKVAFLSNAAHFGDVDEIAVRETRLAWVFLAGSRVYKFKKPLQLPHLDYTTLAERRRICRAELRLNQRLAPDVYLGLARLTMAADGALALNGTGRVVEWLVEMRRLPAALFLDNAIRAGSVEAGDIVAVADRLADFFSTAPPVTVDPAQRVAAYRFELSKCHDVFAEWAFQAVRRTGEDIVNRLETVLNDTPGMIGGQDGSTRIIEGHGDLRPEHVHLSDPPIIIDRLEFSRDLRLLDPFEELSYLAMECAVLGAPWIGPLLLDTCAKTLSGRPSTEQLAFYTAFRATLRARQALAHLLLPHPRKPTKWIPLAQTYLEQANTALIRLRPAAGPPANHPDEDGG